MMKGVIYARVSSEGDRQNTERQIVSLTSWANKNDVEIDKIFSEKKSGGVKNSERIVLQECLKYCVENKIDLLMVNALDRLGRKVDEVLETIKWAKDRGLNVYLEKENMSLFDFKEHKESPFLTIFVSILGTCAELERSAIEYRLSQGLALYKSRGGKVGRHKGSIKPREEYEADYKATIKLLRQGFSVRKTAVLSKTSVSSVQRIKKMFGL